MRHIKKYDYSSQIKADLTSEKLGKPYVAGCGDTIDWNSRSGITGFDEYFYVENRENGALQIYFKNGSTGYYSTDTGSTKSWSAFTDESTIILYNYGDKCYFKNINRSFLANNGAYAIGGNVLSLLNGDDFLTNGNISVVELDLFKNDTYLIDASKLIMCFDKVMANTFNSCFCGCTNLVLAPAMISVNDIVASAGTFAPSFTFAYMFSGCTALITAPEISVPSVNKAAMFSNMFAGCSSLNNVTCLIKNYDFSEAFLKPFDSWLTGVSATGTFVKNKNADWWESGASGIPSGWTVVDSE